ncbi:MAG: acyl-CoA/acyl-ACP dehydrogenase [Proteobacteria bacterium]|nr:acyl-CoA/acyl-ACP dehydrogenase [Pseudomonadota bacterium]
MNFDLNTEQKMLKDSAHKFFAKEADSNYIRQMAEDELGYSKKIWQKMAGLGWTGILVPEENEGSGMSFLDMTVLLYEMGYACFPGPFFSTAVLSVATLLEGANEEQKRELLPKIAEGKNILSLAWLEKSGRYNAKGITAKAEYQDDCYIVSGTKLFVPDANAADSMICALRTTAAGTGSADGISLFLVDTQSEGLSIGELKTIRGDKLAEVVFDKVEVRAENLVGEIDQGWSILEKVLPLAAVAKCAEMIGGAQKVIEMVVDYAKKRYQFGQPIGSFQAIQHHCADILTLVETSTFLTYQAAWRISRKMPNQKEASMAKLWCSDSYRQLVALGHQVIGGAGFMEEFDLQLYFKQAKSSELAFGDADFHREIVAQELGL